MPRFLTAREQYEMLIPWLEERTAAPRSRFPQIPSKGLDALGFSQRKLNNNFMGWMDRLSDRDKEEGGLWYPTGNDWGHHVADLHGRHPDKVFGAMSKYSPQRDWYNNLEDAHNLAQYHGTGTPFHVGGISATDNHRQASRVFDAEDDPDAINAAFLGTKNVRRGGQVVAVPRTPGDLPKTHDFYTALRDPETGGAFNHAHQPAVADSWMSRSMMWSPEDWDEAMAGGKPLSWPGKGTGEGLDKHLVDKKKDKATGKYVVVGTKPPTARDVAARVVGLSGGYDRMRQAMQRGAAAHDMPFAHGAQAAVWKQISKNKNPNEADFPHHKMGPNGQLWNQMWNQRASGLITPENPGFQVAMRTAAHGSTFDPHGPETPPEWDDWGGPEDISAVMRHLRMAPPGWDHWGDRPGLVSLGPSHLAGHYDPTSDDPWSGPEAESLDKSCPYCHAERGQLCDPRCPTHHTDDPRQWKQESDLMSGGHWEPPADLHLRLNGVQHALEYVDRVLGES